MATVVHTGTEVNKGYDPWAYILPQVIMELGGGLIKGMFERDANARNLKLQNRQRQDAFNFYDQNVAPKIQIDRNNPTADLRSLGYMQASGAYDASMGEAYQKAMMPNMTSANVDMGGYNQNQIFDPRTGRMIYDDAAKSIDPNTQLASDTQKYVADAGVRQAGAAASGQHAAAAASKYVADKTYEGNEMARIIAGATFIEQAKGNTNFIPEATVAGQVMKNAGKILELEATKNAKTMLEPKSMDDYAKAIGALHKQDFDGNIIPIPGSEGTIGVLQDAIKQIAEMAGVNSGNPATYTGSPTTVGGTPVASPGISDAPAIPGIEDEIAGYIKQAADAGLTAGQIINQLKDFSRANHKGWTDKDLQGGVNRYETNRKAAQGYRGR